MDRVGMTAVLVAALAGGGCGGVLPVATMSPADLATLREADALIATRLTDVDHAILVNAHGRLVEECMRARGWDVEIPFAPLEAAGGPGAMSWYERWTFSDVAAADAIGYGAERHLADVAAWLQRVEQDGGARMPDPLLMSADDAARFELDAFGTDSERVEIVERDGSGAGMAGGGCYGGATRAIEGDIATGKDLRDARGTAEADIHEATLADPAVADALGRWRRCMAERGYETVDPDAAFDAAFEAAQAGDFAEERRVAAADATCKTSSQLGTTVQAAFLQATTRVLPALREDLAALHAFEAESAGRAKGVLGLTD